MSGERMSVADSITGWRESDPIVRKAEKLGIEIPSEWWFGSASTDPDFKVHIRGLELAKLCRLIRDEQMRRRKEWIGLLNESVGALLPIAGWLVALAAVLKDSILALFQK